MIAPTTSRLPDLDHSRLYSPRSSTKSNNVPSSSALSTGPHPRSKDGTTPPSSGSPNYSPIPWVPDKPFESSPDYSPIPWVPEQSSTSNSDFSWANQVSANSLSPSPLADHPLSSSTDHSHPSSPDFSWPSRVSANSLSPSPDHTLSSSTDHSHPSSPDFSWPSRVSANSLPQSPGYSLPSSTDNSHSPSAVFSWASQVSANSHPQSPGLAYFPSSPSSLPPTDHSPSSIDHSPPSSWSPKYSPPSSGSTDYSPPSSSSPKYSPPSSLAGSTDYSPPSSGSSKYFPPGLGLTNYYSPPSSWSTDHPPPSPLTSIPGSSTGSHQSTDRYPPQSPEPKLANLAESASESESEDFLDKLLRGRIKRHISVPGAVNYSVWIPSRGSFFGRTRSYVRVSTSPLPLHKTKNPAFLSLNSVLGFLDFVQMIMQPSPLVPSFAVVWTRSHTVFQIFPRTERSQCRLTLLKCGMRITDCWMFQHVGRLKASISWGARNLCWSSWPSLIPYKRILMHSCWNRRWS